MSHCRFCLVGAVALTVAAGSFALAQSQNDKKPSRPTTAAQAEDHPAPPDMPAEFQQYMEAWEKAATPGAMHEFLRESIGVWEGKTKQWMMPGAEPMTGTSTTTITPMFNGQYTKAEIEGTSDFGQFNGFGIYGYDNVSEQFVSTWVDSHSTGIMNGTGELSSDGDTVTWVFTYNCPVTGKPKKMREVERRTGPDTAVLEMYGSMPESDEEYKMMEIQLQRVSKKVARGDASPGMLSDKKAEVGCGLCSYQIDGAQSCILAVEIDGKPYLVTGSDINVHQFCGARGAKPAVISGKIKDGKFAAKEIEVQSVSR